MGVAQDKYKQWLHKQPIQRFNAIRASVASADTVRQSFVDGFTAGIEHHKKQVAKKRKLIRDAASQKDERDYPGIPPRGGVFGR